MEKPLDRHLEDLMNSPGVVGVLCTDSGGLCLGAKGIAQKDKAGAVAGIAEQVANLHPDAKEKPVVCIESEAGNILINSQNGITVGLYKATT